MQTLRNDLVTTRRQHICGLCHEKFPAGTKMHSWASVDSGDFYHGYTCQCCQSYMNKTFEPGDMVGDGEFAGEPDYEEFKKYFYANETVKS